MKIWINISAELTTIIATVFTFVFLLGFRPFQHSCWYITAVKSRLMRPSSQLYLSLGVSVFGVFLVEVPIYMCVSCLFSCSSRLIAVSITIAIALIVECAVLRMLRLRRNHLSSFCQQCCGRLVGTHERRWVVTVMSKRNVYSFFGFIQVIDLSISHHFTLALLIVVFIPSRKESFGGRYSDDCRLNRFRYLLSICHVLSKTYWFCHSRLLILELIVNLALRSNKASQMTF